MRPTSGPVQKPGWMHLVSLRLRSVLGAAARPGRRWETSKETEAQREETLAQGDTVDARGWSSSPRQKLTGPPWVESGRRGHLDLALSVPDSGAALTGRLMSGKGGESAKPS